MKSHQRTIGLNDEWLTPPELQRALGKFDLDPCSPINRPWATAHAYLTIEDDGLSHPWTGRVWLNPPFSRRVRPLWMQKMADHGNGIMLIPAATETAAFEKWVWRSADAVCFVKGRPHFHYVTGERAKANCGTAIVLVAYGPENSAALEAANLGRTLMLTARATPQAGKESEA